MKKIYLFIFCLIGCAGEIPDDPRISDQSRFRQLSSYANGERKESFVESIPQGRISGYPQMEVVGNKVIFAWT